MDSEEVEYQCSECGTTVKVDEKVCPKCDAPLEDLSTNYELERIPVTSNPADIAVIESLLKDNNIEYSIINDSLDTTFGLSLGHSSTLMVRKDQVDLAKQILNEYQEENTMTPNKTIRHTSLKGVKGWLLFLCTILTILNPVMSLPYITRYFVDSRSDLKWYPLLGTALDIVVGLTILILLYGVYVGIALWRIQPDAIRSAILYLNAYLVFTIVMFLTVLTIFLISDVPYNETSQKIFGDLIKETIRAITFVVIWKLYLRHSERVMNTYGR
jgi:DNA-directed RNA polymerase subunit RPC12/RpoP